ncbi:MAG: mannose-1-phosphate guanylyltransferase [Planctomycetota bacterium]|nr:MAG: mannose-1-phosphate guanylyltransferase [Planctomycetota bacterium]
MLHAVIMAGGSGTRFWPESRDLRPKQLLKLVGERSMIQATTDRLEGLVPRDRVLIATNARQAAGIAEQLPELPATALLLEPCKRDTAPCIALAAAHLAKRDPDAIMAVIPSDHVIRPTEKFQQAIQLSADLVAESPNRIVTLGIRPTYPAESFGYIERGEPLANTAKAQVAPVYRVVRFREKPKAAAAAEFLAAGNCFWNAGIFVWRATTILDYLQRLQPELYAHINAIASAIGTSEYPAILEREFAAIKGISIDYAVMEHASDVVVIEAPFDWDDVGSWQSLARLVGTDADGNTVSGRHLGINTKGTIVRTNGEHLVVTIGLEDCIVVHTPDATLVARKQDEEAVREVAQQLPERGWRELL